MNTKTLRTIPVIDARGKTAAAQTVRQLPEYISELFAEAQARYTPTGLSVGNAISRQWLMRNQNPYLPEIDEVAGLVGKPGTHLLSLSYEWACTSGAGQGRDGVQRLVRVLDWDLAGLGRNLVVVRQQGPAGEWLNIGWPGTVGCFTGVAPGRFAIAINQPPLPAKGLTVIGDWLLSRPAIWNSNALPPAFLLRKVFDEAATYVEAVQMLRDTEISTPVFYTIAGPQPGENCVIERLQNEAAVNAKAPACVANDWLSMNVGGLPRGWDSDGRRALMTTVVPAMADEDLSWLAPPILNPTTRLVLVAQPGTGKLIVQGYEEDGAATHPLTLDPATL
jgi:hypothetical protein